MEYRRAYVPGGTYFFTVNLANRKKTYLTDYIHCLKQAIRTVKQSHPFCIDAMVVLPDHLHAVWTLPEDDADFATRWRLIKSAFSRDLPKREIIDTSRRRKGERAIWQRRFWEHVVRDEKDFASHIDYIHFNPVKHGYVERAIDWPYSTIHAYIRNGVIPRDWGFGQSADERNFGERADS